MAVLSFGQCSFHAGGFNIFEESNNGDLWTQMSVQNPHVINLNTQVKILISDTVGNVI